MSDHRIKEVESYNRLFILGGRGCSEDTFRNEFGKFGHVKDVFIMKDKHSGEDRGIVYITFDKISDAARAMEEMNGKCISGNSKPLKVLIANSKGSGRDPKEDEKLLRLFIMIPKSMNESDVQSVFQTFGDIEYVRILKDKNSGQPKGLAYVKYFKASHAATAFENCDSQYKPVFASNAGGGKSKDRDQRSMSDGGNYSSPYNDSVGGYSNTSRYPPPFNSPSAGPSMSMAMSSSAPVMGDYLRGFPSHGDTDIEIQFVCGLTEAQVQAVCDLPPGLEFTQYDRSSGWANLRYCSPQAAAYAKKKFERLEYPPGCPVAVRFASENPARYTGGPNGSSVGGSVVADMAQNLHKLTSEGQTDLFALAHSIQKAAELLQQAGFSSTAGVGNGAPAARPAWNTNNLPPVQPLVSKDTPVAERLFFVSQPEPFPDHIIADLMCRFGSFIDGFFMPGNVLLKNNGKNYGYAKFASKQSAERAIQTLHGHNVFGNRLKVMLAEPPRNERSDGANYDSKRARHD